MNTKRGQMWDTLIPWIIAAAVLVIIVVFAFFLRERLDTMGDFIKNLFRK